MGWEHLSIKPQLVVCTIHQSLAGRHLLLLTHRNLLLIMLYLALLADKGHSIYQEEPKHSTGHHCQLLSSVDCHSALTLVSHIIHLCQNGVWLAVYVS